MIREEMLQRRVDLGVLSAARARCAASPLNTLDHGCAVLARVPRVLGWHLDVSSPSRIPVNIQVLESREPAAATAAATADTTALISER